MIEEGYEVLAYNGDAKTQLVESKDERDKDDVAMDSWRADLNGEDSVGKT